MSVAGTNSLAAEDADVTFQLYGVVCSTVEIRKTWKTFYWGRNAVGKRFSNAWSLLGVSLIKIGWYRKSVDLESDLKKLEQEIFELSGEEFNMNSPRPVRRNSIWKNATSDPKAKKTKTGQYMQLLKISWQKLFPSTKSLSIY